MGQNLEKYHDGTSNLEILGLELQKKGAQVLPVPSHYKICQADRLAMWPIRCSVALREIKLNYGSHANARTSRKLSNLSGTGTHLRFLRNIMLPRCPAVARLHSVAVLTKLKKWTTGRSCKCGLGACYCTNRVACLLLALSISDLSTPSVSH